LKIGKHISHIDGSKLPTRFLIFCLEVKTLKNFLDGQVAQWVMYFSPHKK